MFNFQIFTECPECFAALNPGKVFKYPGEPKGGDYLVCLRCQKILIFRADGPPRVPTMTELGLGFYGAVCGFVAGERDKLDAGSRCSVEAAAGDAVAEAPNGLTTSQHDRFPNGRWS